MDLRKLDALVCETLGIPGRTIWILTRDAGKSFYYSSDYKPDVEKHLSYLKSRHATSPFANGEVSSWIQYPEVSSSISEAWRVRDELQGRGIYLNIRAGADFDEVTATDSDGRVLAYYAHPSTAEAIAVTAIHALGVEVPE